MGLELDAAIPYAMLCYAMRLLSVPPRLERPGSGAARLVWVGIGLSSLPAFSFPSSPDGPASGLGKAKGGMQATANGGPCRRRMGWSKGKSLRCWPRRREERNGGASEPRQPMKEEGQYEVNGGALARWLGGTHGVGAQ